MVFFVCVSNNGQHIRVLYTRVSFVSGSTLHMKIYFDPFKKKRGFFLHKMLDIFMW